MDELFNEFKGKLLLGRRKALYAVIGDELGLNVSSLLLNESIGRVSQSIVLQLQEDNSDECIVVAEPLLNSKMYSENDQENIQPAMHVENDHQYERNIIGDIDATFLFDDSFGEFVPSVPSHEVATTSSTDVVCLSEHRAAVQTSSVPYNINGDCSFKLLTTDYKSIETSRNWGRYQDSFLIGFVCKAAVPPQLQGSFCMLVLRLSVFYIDVGEIRCPSGKCGGRMRTLL